MSPRSVDFYVDSQTGLPVFSVYGKRGDTLINIIRNSTAEMIVFDIQVLTIIILSLHSISVTPWSLSRMLVFVITLTFGHSGIPCWLHQHSTFLLLFLIGNHNTRPFFFHSLIIVLALSSLPLLKDQTHLVVHKY
jgi:hypothetical protein